MMLSRLLIVIMEEIMQSSEGGGRVDDIHTRSNVYILNLLT